jgi:hypothetical protein
MAPVLAVGILLGYAAWCDLLRSRIAAAWRRQRAREDVLRVDIDAWYRLPAVIPEHEREEWSA